MWWLIFPGMLNCSQKFNCFVDITKLPEDKAHWHTLKQSIEVHLSESGADGKKLQYYLDHKRIYSTMVNFHLTTKHQDAFYKTIDGIMLKN